MSIIKTVSIVVPVYNEQENLPVLFEEIRQAMEPTKKTWQVIFIDDGSRDKSLDVIKSLASEHDTVRYISLRCNCGQSAGFKAGFDKAEGAEGDVVVTMDADLQNDPADIPAMLTRYERGFDMIIGWRAKRQDTLAKRYASKIGNFIRNSLSNENVRDTGCSLKVMNAAMAKKLPMFTGMHRFLPTLMKMNGARVSEMKVNHRQRLHGQSKYGVWDRAKTTFFDLLAVRWMQRRQYCLQIKEEK